jgi:redox-sensitive bicupin YhaK (pirin superfamily)
MLNIRKSEDRGHAQHGWLDSYHTFSFANYHDPQHMGFRSLRVINQDMVVPDEGFGAHSHRDMEIISYVVSGKLSHKDSMGTVATLERGDVQVMSAGTGVTHSEFNGGSDQPVRFLQIWIMPDERNHKPRYADKRFSDDAKRDRLCVIASPDGREGSLPIHQNVTLYASLLGEGKTIAHKLGDGRHAWVQLIAGALKVNGTVLRAGDGLRISEEKALLLEANEAAEFLLFDLN